MSTIRALWVGATVQTRLIVYAVVAVIIGIVGYSVYQHFQPVPMVGVKKIDTPSVRYALNEAGFKLSDRETKNVADAIKWNAKHEQSDYEATVPTETEADNKVKEVAKKDKADVVIKEKQDPAKPTEGIKPGVDIVYYGVKMEKKWALGAYADLDADGSYGAHLRKERVVIQVGKKYKDGSTTGRVAYEAIKF